MTVRNKRSREYMQYVGYIVITIIELFINVLIIGIEYKFVFTLCQLCCKLLFVCLIFVSSYQSLTKVIIVKKL